MTDRHEYAEISEVSRMKADFVQVIDRGKPRHYCVLPTWWGRWRTGLKPDCIVECTECGQRWTRTTDYGGDWYWKRLNDGSARS